MDEEKEVLKVQVSTRLTSAQFWFVDLEAEIADVSRAEYIRYLIDRERRCSKIPIIGWILRRLVARWKKREM